MKIVEPFAIVWEPKDIEKHIVRCAQVCYASEKIPDNIHAWLEAKWKQGHKSIFRHGTYYFVIPVINCTDMMRSFFINSPYIGYYENKEYVFISANGQVYREIPWFHHLFRHSTSEIGLYALANDDADRIGITKIIRRTVYIQTQISTSRELNRTSPNTICEQSTRYCNYTNNKFDGDVSICKPWWWDDVDISDKMKAKYIRSCEESTDIYKEMVGCGIKPQDARGLLPLDTATKCVYTYTIAEWAHILDLRYYGTTGKPHPNAKYITNLIREELNATLTDIDFLNDTEVKSALEGYEK